MAIYRDNSTGFLGEFATNPGATHTLVSAQPTDTQANRVNWYRALDTFGQSSAWHPSITRAPEDPGEAVVTLQLTQENALISADFDGTVTNPRDPTNTFYLGATTDVRVFRGVTDVTVSEGWTLTKVDDGCTSTLTQTGGLYTLKITSIPLLATKSGFVRIKATRTGSGDYIRDFRWIKVFAGNDGQDGADGNDGQDGADGNDGQDGADGADGINGVDGTRGSRQIVITGTVDWTDLAAWNGLVSRFGGTPVLSDLVTIVNTTTNTSTSKFLTGNTASPGTWVAPGAYINGNLLVTGTVGADKIAAGTITGQTIILSGAASIIKSSNYVQNSAGWAIKGDGTAEFSAASIRGTLTADKIVGGTLDASRITVSNLSANSITGGTINANTINIDGTNITSGFISVARLQDGSLTGVKLADLTVTAAKIADATITSAKIADLTVTNAKIANATIEAAKINTVNASSIQTGTLTSKTITLDGGAIQTSNYTAGGTLGWQIDGAGNAHFNTVMVRTGNIEASGVTVSKGYAAAANTTITRGGSVDFWKPTLAAASYGRGNVAFTSAVGLLVNITQNMTLTVLIYRDSVEVRRQTIALGPAMKSYTVNLLYLDTAHVNTASAYQFTLTADTLTSGNASDYVHVYQIDEFWVEYKR